MYTYELNAAARTVSGEIVDIPDQVFQDQKGYDGKTFPVLKNGRKVRARLCGELYGLNTPGTGDPVVRIV